MMMMITIEMKPAAASKSSIKNLGIMGRNTAAPVITPPMLVMCEVDAPGAVARPTDASCYFDGVWNPYKSKHGVGWEEVISKVGALSGSVCITKLVQHMHDETAAMFDSFVA